MPMYGIIGTPGAGKTLFAMQKILPGFLEYCEQIKQYREIYHNIEGLNITELFALMGKTEKEVYWAEHFHDLTLDETTGKPDENRARYFWLLKVFIITSSRLHLRTLMMRQKSINS